MRNCTVIQVQFIFISVLRQLQLFSADPIVVNKRIAAAEAAHIIQIGQHLIRLQQLNGNGFQRCCIQNLFSGSLRFSPGIRQFVIVDFDLWNGSFHFFHIHLHFTQCVPGAAGTVSVESMSVANTQPDRYHFALIDTGDHIGFAVFREGGADQIGKVHPSVFCGMLIILDMMVAFFITPVQLIVIVLIAIQS